MARPRGDHVAGTRPLRQRRNLIAKQRADRHIVRAAERPEREGERRQHAVEQRERQRRRINRRIDRQRQESPEGEPHAVRQRRAERDPNHTSEGGQQHHLHQIDQEHFATARAERLQRRDAVAAAIEMALHRITDAHTTDEQRRQPDDGQKLRKAVDVALDLRASRACACGFAIRPAGIVARA